MQYVVIARDHKDSEALNRRLAAREEHLDAGQKLRDEGKLLYALAMVNDEGKMAGSVMVLDFATREEFDAWLANEAYVRNRVWDQIEVQGCRVAPLFVKTS